jgi:hypothetical protein
MSTGRRISLPHGYKLKEGRLVPCTRHLPLNLRLQKQAKGKVKVARRPQPR